MEPTEGKLKKLYETLKTDGYELPADYTVFEKDMSDDKRLNSLYDNLVSDGYELPADRAFFKADMFGNPVKKKDQSGESESAEPSLESSLPVAEKDSQPLADASQTNGVDNTLELSGGTLPEVEKVGDSELVENKEFVGAVPEGFYPGKSGQMIPEEQSESEFSPADNKYGSAFLNRTADVATRFYNAFIPGAVRGIGNTIDLVGDAAEMGVQPWKTNLDEDKLTDTFSKYLRSKATDWEDYVSPKGQVSVLDEPTNPVAWAGAIAEGGATLSQIVLTGGGAAAVAVSGALGVDAVKESAREAGLSDRDAAVLTIAVAPAVASLDLLGLEAITSNKTAVSGIIKEIIAKTGGKFTKNAVVKAVSEVMPEVVKRGGKGALGEGITEAGQEIVTGAAEMAYDATQEEDKFKTTPKEIAKRALVSGAIGGVLGGSLGAAGRSQSETEEDATPKTAAEKITGLEEQLRRAIAVQDKVGNKELWQANIDRIKGKLEAARKESGKPESINDIPEIAEANKYHEEIIANPESADFEVEAAKKALDNPVGYLEELRQFHQERANGNETIFEDGEEIGKLTVAIDKARSILNPQPITPEQSIDTALETLANATPETVVASAVEEAQKIADAVKSTTEPESFEVGETVELSAVAKPVVPKPTETPLELDVTETTPEPEITDVPEVVESPESIGEPDDAVVAEEIAPETAEPVAETPATPEPKQPTRQFVEKLKEQSNVDKRFDAELERLLPREEVSQDDTQVSAIQHIKAQGLETAYDQIIAAGTKSEISGLDAVTSQAVRGEMFDVYNRMVQEAEAAGNTELADSYYDKASNILDAMAVNSTNTARALAYQARLGKLFETKQGAQRAAKKAKERVAEDTRKKSEKHRRTAKDAVSEFKKESKAGFVKSNPVQKAVTKTINKAVSKAKQATPTPDKLKKLKDQRAALKAEYLKNKRSSLNSTIIGIDAADIAYYSQVAVTYIKGGVIKLDDVIKRLKAYAEREHDTILSADDLDAIITDEVKAEINKHPKAILSTNKAAIDELLTKHFDANGKITELQTKLVDELNLDPVTAAELATELDTLFKDYATKRKEALIAKRLPKKKPLVKQPKEVREFYQDVIELSNLGAVGDAKYNDLINQKIGSTDLTREEASEINRMVDVINSTPEGQFRNIEVQKLMDYIANLGGKEVGDYVIASYKAGLFSGITTQVVNISSNVAGTIGVIANIGLTKPQEFTTFLKGFKDGVPGAFMNAAELIRSGYDPRNVEEAPMRILERKRRGFFGTTKAVKLDPTLESYKRFTFRMLKAMDMLTSVPTTVARQAVLERRAGKELGLSGVALKEYVREQMGYDQSIKDEARRKATKEVENDKIPLNLPDNATPAQIEAKKAKIINLRTQEIITQARNQKLLKQSKEYAELLNYMNQPTGTMGIVAQGVNGIIRKLPALNLVIPVVNIAANIAQRGMQLTPPIAIARAVVKSGVNLVKGQSIPDQIGELREKLQAGDAETELRVQRAVVGTVAMLLMMGLTAEDEEGESMSGVKIHGGGPDQPEKKYQLQETGWRPFSIEVDGKYYGYKNLPLNFMLSMIGSYYDASRYGKTPKEETQERMMYAMGNMGGVIFQSTFLKSILVMLRITRKAW